MKTGFLFFLIIFGIFLNGIAAPPPTPAIVCDSTLYVAWTIDSTQCTLPASFGISAAVCDSNATAGDTLWVKVLDGEGDTDSTAFVFTLQPNGTIKAQGNIFINYDSAGIFLPALSALSEAGAHYNVVINPYTHLRTGQYCSRLFGRIYADCNNNCAYNSEPLLNNIRVLLKDNNGQPIDSTVTDNWGNYKFWHPTGQFYEIILSGMEGYPVTNICSMGGSAQGYMPQSDLSLDLAAELPFEYDIRPGFHTTPFIIGNVGYARITNRLVGCSSGTTINGHLFYDANQFTPSNPITGLGYNMVTQGEMEWSNNYLFPNSDNESTFLFGIPSGLIEGDSICITYMIEPDTTYPVNNSVTVCHTATNNATWPLLQVLPTGTGNQGFIPSGTALTYTLFFRNPIHDTASVMIIDSLDTDLSFSSLEIINSSYPVVPQLTTYGVNFFFPNLLLDIASVSEHTSFGSITFRLTHLPGLPDGTEILNRAHIIYSSEIGSTTETSNSTLNTVLNPLSVRDQTSYSGMVQPNPFTETLIINSLIPTELSQISIFDPTGRIIHEEIITGYDSFSLPTADWNKGFYLVRLQTSKQITIHPVIKQ